MLYLIGISEIKGELNEISTILLMNIHNLHLSLYSILNHLCYSLNIHFDKYYSILYYTRFQPKSQHKKFIVAQ